jgi:hypothetical protein
MHAPVGHLLFRKNFKRLVQVKCFPGEICETDMRIRVSDVREN